MCPSRLQREEDREAVLAEAFEQHVGQYVRRVWSLFPCALVQTVGTHWEPAVEADLARCLSVGPLGRGHRDSLAPEPEATEERPADTEGATTAAYEASPQQQVPTIEAFAELQPQQKHQTSTNFTPASGLESIAEGEGRSQSTPVQLQLQTQMQSQTPIVRVDAAQFLREEIIGRTRQLVASFNVDTHSQLEAWLSSAGSGTSFPIPAGEPSVCIPASSRYRYVLVQYCTTASWLQELFSLCR